MEIVIKDELKNPLLNRTEIHFDCLYQGETTPKILDVRNKLVSILNADKKLLVVDKIKPTFGEGRADGYAKVYDSKDCLEEIESKHILLKNQEPQKEEEPQEESNEEKPEEE
ncbi:MAG: 30S ribosomal protein S24e [Euryarchaeota archaeon]|nr:30S ribosomal protein S24e [Euryarchaeota archaeon]